MGTPPGMIEVGHSARHLLTHVFPAESVHLLTYDTLRSKKSILAELNDWDTCWPTHLKHEAPASNRNPSALGQGVKI